jgi:hypothetical protein
MQSYQKKGGLILGGGGECNGHWKPHKYVDWYISVAKRAEEYFLKGLGDVVMLILKGMLAVEDDYLVPFVHI